MLDTLARYFLRLLISFFKINLFSKNYFSNNMGALNSLDSDENVGSDLDSKLFKGLQVYRSTTLVGKEFNLINVFLGAHSIYENMFLSHCRFSWIFLHYQQYSVI